MGQSSSTENGVCSTPACVHAASSMMQNLAHNWEQLNPCTDFHEMACGGFRQRTGKDFARAGGEIVQNHIWSVIREVIERPYKESAEYHDIMIRNNIDEQNHQMLQRDYQSCMDTAAREKTGRAPLVKLLDDFAEVWPITIDQVDDTAPFSSSDRQHMHGAITFLEKLGIPSFRMLTLQRAQVVALPNLLEPTVKFHAVGPPAADAEFLFKDPSKAEEVTADIAKIFAAGFFPGGKNMSDSKAESLAKEIAQFETEMIRRANAANLESQALLTENPDLGFMAGIETLTFDELADLAPALGLDKVLTFFSPADSTPDAILVSSPSFFANVSSLLESTPKAVVQSWMIFKIVHEFRREVNDPVLAEIYPPHDTKLFQNCLLHTDETMRWIMDRYFVSAAYTDAAKDLVEKMTTNIQSILVQRFSELDWMSDEVKAKAVEKAEKMSHNIGFPTQNPDLRSPNSLAAYYQGLNITDDYFSNVLAGRLNNRRTIYAAIGKPVDRDQWLTSAHEFGATYSILTNAMFINAGFTQSPGFHPDLPSYALYGSVGFTIGHETTHGFDSAGKGFDERGAIKNWFDNTSSAAYNERAQCFINQFSKFQFPISGGKTANVSGERTLAENIADAGGLSIAFDAWKALGDGEKNDQKLPGLEHFTQEQLFFLSWANGWCAALNDEKEMEDTFVTDTHSPDNFRIIGGAQNSRPFLEAWNCPVKEPECEIF